MILIQERCSQVNPSSITFGAQDPQENGYRLSLHDQLTGRGNNVDFVGSVESGAFADKQHEGHRKKRISEISDLSSLGIYAAANIVLLHAGTNDMNQNFDVKNAPGRLKDLISLIYEHSPSAAVFVCQIIPSSTRSIQTLIEAFNPHIPGIVDGFLHEGKHITLVNMSQAVSVSDLSDNLHPNARGYQNMANAYYDAITKADAKGWISKAGKEEKPPPDATSPENCKTSPLWVNTGQIATGAKVFVSR